MPPRELPDASGRSARRSREGGGARNPCGGGASFVLPAVRGGDANESGATMAARRPSVSELWPTRVGPSTAVESVPAVAGVLAQPTRDDLRKRSPPSTAVESVPAVAGVLAQPTRDDLPQRSPPELNPQPPQNR